MISWIRRLLGVTRKKDPEPDAKRNADAKTYLDDFRQNELSVGAALRRGEVVDHAPGQAGGARATALERSRERRAERVDSLRAPCRPAGRPESSSSSSSENFGLSMVVGEATGNAMAGYAVGGSLTGGLIGAELSASSGSLDSPSDS